MSRDPKPWVIDDENHVMVLNPTKTASIAAPVIRASM
jgi:hypothetical protein